MPPLDRALLFDWGNTLMEDIPGFSGPMADWPRVAVLPGVPETLASLKPAWRLVLATNAADSDESDIRVALRRAAIDPLIDEIYCFRRLGHKKPSPEFFQAVLADLRLPASRVIMVGDSLEGDVLGAARAGLRAVWFHPGGPETVETAQIRTIRDFRELPALLADLAPDLASPDRTPFTTDEHG
jgi:HAD superfamily hydrolase (TIGR01662 family)